MNVNAAVIPLRGPAQALRHNLRLLLPALLLFTALMGVSAWRALGAPVPWSQTNGVPVSREIEARYGVQITGLYFVAKGGLIDLRYRVVDAAKAKDFGHYTETSPLLISEKDGRAVEVTIMMLHNHRVETGRSYYVLYRNTGDAIHPGTPVTVQIGNLSLKHLIAR